jgi:dTMP kinase
MAAARRGAFVVFEGLDRSGKSTQTQLLLKALEERKVPCALQRFPDRTTPSGILLDKFLRKELIMDDMAVHNLFSQNRWECLERMKEQLKAGVTLIVDRYAFSGVVYTASKGHDVELCKKPDVGLIAPDAVIFVDVDLESLGKRGGWGGETYEREDFQRKVYEHYTKVREANWHMVPGDRAREEVHADILRIVLPLLDKVGNTEPGVLWKNSSVS